MKLLLSPDLSLPFTRLTQETLGVPVTTERLAEGATRDLASTVTLALSIPPALLATWDLAERIGLLSRVRTWLDALRAQQGADAVTLQLPAGPAPLASVTPDQVLEAAKAQMPRGNPDERDWDAFVIHASGDRADARRVWEALTVAGVDVFLDRASLRPGFDWARRLADAMKRTRVFVVLVSDRWREGWYNDDEVARAVSLCREHRDRALLPVVLGDTGLPPHDLPYGLAHVQQVVIGGLDRTAADASVVEAVTGLLGSRVVAL